jgi:rod shape determining protein RodA
MTATERPSSWWHHLDFLIVISALAIAAYGVLMVFSATRGADPTEPANTSFLVRQLAFIVLGALLMVAVAAIDYRVIQQYASLAYAGLVIALGGVLVAGVEVNGAQAWFSLGPFQLQPSEFGKIVLIVVLGALYGLAPSPTLRRVVVGLMIVALPVGLILLQPDVGTVLIYAAIIAAVLVAAGVRPSHLALIGAGLVISVAVLLGSGKLEDYQVSRLTVFLTEETADESDSLQQVRYQVDQAQIAIGNGGVTGRGLFEGTQTRSRNIPEQQTDFIFTVVGEELGLVGSAGLLMLYALLISRMWRVASLTNDFTAMLVCTGVMAMFLFQMFQSIGMNLGMMPVTGIPLPLFSYGGSSVLTSFIGIGLVLNVHLRRFS